MAFNWFNEKEGQQVYSEMLTKKLHVVLDETEQWAGEDMGQEEKTREGGRGFFVTYTG